MFDQVCGMELMEKENLKTSYDGKTYYFCSDECRKDFKKRPKFYIESDGIICIEDVWKIFELDEVQIKVLRGLSMRVHDGDLVALIGASGSGKSTALNILGTLDVPTKGSVHIAGKDTGKMSENDLARLRSEKIGFVFQQFNLIPALSAIENVMLPALLLKKNYDKSKERAEKLLKDVGLEGRGSHKPMQLSGGEQQRVAIARAFMNDPEIILADEPTGNLDSKTSTVVIKMLVDFWKQKKKTIVIITHDPHVANHAQRILNMKDGKLVRNHKITEQSVWAEKNHIKHE